MDRARTSALAGRVVIWEESARDGAQGKTLIGGTQRVALARSTGSLFGAHGPDHVIFAAGFPAICGQEFEIMRRLATEVDNCSLASHGRATMADVELGLKSLAGAAHPRMTFWIPASPDIAEVIGMNTPNAALRRGLDILDHALGLADGTPVDIALVGCSRADPVEVADMALALSAAGAGIIKVCDTLGEFHPRTAADFFRALFARLGSDAAGIAVGAHLHNDLGFALANNLEGLDAGVRVLASSWLGIGERNGLAATEQLLFALAHEPVAHAYRPPSGQPPSNRLWLTPPDLTGLVPIARRVSVITEVPIKVTDPIIGSGVNTISTGTPFLSRAVFQPFDPEDLLGIPSEVLLTQLASKRVIDAVAAERGILLTGEQVEQAMTWVKDTAYSGGRAIVPKDDFFAFLRELETSQRDTSRLTASPIGG